LEKIRYGLYGFLFSIAVFLFPVQPASAGIGCGDSKVLISSLLNNGRAFFSTAITQKALTIMLFVSRSGEWEIVAIDENGLSCITAHGTEWQWAMERVL